RPGIIFLRIPESWARDAAVEVEFKKALADVLGRSGRISAVIIRWTETSALKQGANWSAAADWCHTEYNPKARHSLVEFGDIILSPLRADLWRTIPDMIGRPSPSPAWWSFFVGAL